MSLLPHCRHSDDGRAEGGLIIEHSSFKDEHDETILRPGHRPRRSRRDAAGAGRESEAWKAQIVETADIPASKLATEEPRPRKGSGHVCSPDF